MAHEELIKEARESLVTPDKAKAVDVANRALAAGISPQQIMAEGFIAGIR